MSDILVAREARSQLIQDLIEKNPYHTIAVLKLNVVGTNKNPVHMRFICMMFHHFMIDEFQQKILKYRKVESLDGDYIYYIIAEDGNLVKDRTIHIEDSHFLGRLVDIDVYHQTSISRTDMQCEMRKCLICDNYAHICSRNQTHSQEVINKKVMALIHEHLPKIILQETLHAIYDELDLYPTFGLVTHRDSGSHTDMDYQTFVNSIFAIKPYLEEFIRFGLQEEQEIDELIAMGQSAEQAMFQATGNINTQKGLVFALGLFLPVLSKAIITNQSVSFIIKDIKRIAETVIGDYYDVLEPRSASTHGDSIYLQCGAKGIRGEALKGFSLVFSLLERSNDFETKNIDYLLQLMAKLDDTTIIYKKGIEGLHDVQDQVKAFLLTGGIIENKEQYIRLSDTLKKQGISPGGSSDLLVVRMIFDRLKHLMIQCKTI